MAQYLNLFTSTSHSPEPLISKPSLPFPQVNFRLPHTNNLNKSPFFVEASASDANPSIFTSGNGPGGVFSAALQDNVPFQAVSDSSSIEVDAVTEAELKENGFRRTQRTKLICTIGPASSF